METGDPPSSWTAFLSATLDGVADERTGGAGAQSLSVVNGAASAAYAQQVFSANPGQQITITGWGKRVSTNPRIQLVDGSGVIAEGTTSNTSWTELTVVGTLVSGTPGVRLKNTNSTLGLESRFDDLIVWVSG
jgi:hypothetical protein